MLNGGRAEKATVLPVSFSVNQTCSLSGDTAMFGQKGLGCTTRPTMVERLASS